jgi:hypothetical protein
MNLFLTKEALYRLSYVGTDPELWLPRLVLPGTGEKGGAGDEVRTRDLQLGRLELYQLSYSRPKPSISPAAPSSTPGGTLYHLNTSAARSAEEVT